MEENDMVLAPAVGIEAANRKEAKQVGERLADEGADIGYYNILNSKHGKARRLANVMRRAYGNRKATEYQRVPDSELIERIRVDHDPDALKEYMAKYGDKAGKGVAAAVGASFALPVVLGTTIPLVTGATAVPAWLSATGKAVADFGADLTKAALDNPVARFIYSRPVQATKAIVTGTPFVWNWAVNGQKPSGTEAGKWALETALGVGLGGSVKYAYDAAAEIPSYFRLFGNGIKETGFALRDVYRKGVAKGAYYAEKYALHNSPSYPFSKSLYKYLNSVPKSEQAWFDRTFTPEKLEELSRANKENFIMRLRESFDPSVRSYYDYHPDSFNRLVDAYTKRFNFEIKPYTRFYKLWGRGSLGMTSKIPSLPNIPGVTEVGPDFFGEKMPKLFVGILGKPNNRFSPYEIAMHEYHHASEAVAKRMYDILNPKINPAIPKTFWRIFENPNKPFLPVQNIFVFPPYEVFTYNPSFSSITTNPSKDNLYDRMNGVVPGSKYDYSNKNQYVMTPAEMRARIAGFSYIHNPERELYKKPFSSWSGQEKIDFLKNDRRVYPSAYRRNLYSDDEIIKAIEEYPYELNREGGKIMKRYF